MRFLEQLSQATIRSNRSKIPFVLVYLDVDKFKEINDTHGHTIGDRVLQEISKRIKSVIREGDTPARLGGDEFAVILEGISSDNQTGKYLVIDRMIQELNAKPYHLTPDVTLNVKTSFGTSLYPVHAANIEDLIHDADQSMYTAKKTGTGFSAH